MRTIKFRGKDAENGMWIYGDLFQRIGFYPQIIESFADDNGKLAYRGIAVQENTVGQFTGLHDAKGNPIYEGDIIKGDREYMHLIRYDEERAQFTATGLQYIDDRIFDKMNAGCVYQSWIDEFQKVVVGNRYDNPELMKGK